MKKINATILTIAIAAAGCQVGAKDVPLNTDQQKASYAIGQQIGRQMKSQGVKVDVDALAMSISDALAGKKSRLTEEEMQKAMQSMQEAVMKEQAEEGKKNREKGEAFLKENMKKQGVKTTKSGLQYEVIKEGKGASPKASDKVKVHYRGTLLDGTEFDSSYARNAPAEFPLNAVIPGWTEGLQLMKPGALYKLYVPGDLAYGERGRPSIPSNSVLIFEVELLEILK